jgi:hypothetical protein
MDTSKTLIISGFDVIVDAQDAHILGEGVWRVIDKPRNRYAKLNKSIDGKVVTLYLHRLIAGAQSGDTVDHINGNTLDNRRSNLRKVGRNENARNRVKKVVSTSRFKGVSFHTPTGRWRMQIRTDRARVLKAFRNEFEAAYWYDMMSLEHHGDHGVRNFLPLA